MKLLYAIDGDFGFITLSNPPYNLLTSPVFEDREALAGFLESPGIKGVLIRGEGHHFCGGADLGALERQAKEGDGLAELLDRGKELLATLSSATVPVAAVIRGGCLGAGLEIALSCHFRFAATTAMLGFPETDHGIMPGLGGTLLSPRRLGRGGAMELILSGKILSGEDAKTAGLVDECAPAADVESCALEFLGRITAGRSSELIRAVMTSINNAGRLPFREALIEETRLFVRLARGTGGGS